MPLTTWTKLCFRVLIYKIYIVLLSHVERILYTYMYVYDVVWHSDRDESLLIWVSVA